MTVEEQYDLVRGLCAQCAVRLDYPFRGYPLLFRGLTKQPVVVLRLPPEGAALLFRFHTCEPAQDHVAAGVLADWLKENGELVVYETLSASDVEETSGLPIYGGVVRMAIDLLVGYLANRFETR